MSIPDQLELFIKWIQAFDHRLLQNEDDVETKFILPMFQYLGYPEGCRRGKYPLNAYSPGKQGRKPEIDQVYFATDEIKEQDADTSLILVEAKEPQKTNLDEAIKQAQFYDSYLEPIFLVVTNGYQIKVLKRHRYRGKESIFDISLDSLRDTAKASEFYKQLNFEVVKGINENTANLLTHNKYVLLEESLKRHPDLQEILDQGDFNSSTTVKANSITVVKPKVAINCNLPQGIRKGDCKIEFSSVILRGLTIHLNHQYILGQLMTGLNTQPHWGTRRFLRQIDNNTFEAHLGETRVILSQLEATDLCLCVDEVCKEYKNRIIESETILETWDFDFVEFEGIRGFRLFSVEEKLWKLMHSFANEFDYSKGNSDWHIFCYQRVLIQVSRRLSENVFIWPKACIDTDSYGLLLPNRQIDVVYEIYDVHLKSIERGNVTSWKKDVGSRGIWTALYTKKLLLEKFIPKVIDYYSQQSHVPQAEWQLDIKDHAAYKCKRVPIKEIDEVRDLAPYLYDIQSWLGIYGKNIATSLLRSYYKSFTELVRNTDPSITGMDYITKNLRTLEIKNKSENVHKKSREWSDWSYQRVLDCLEQQIARINNCEHENFENADLISCIFIWIIKNGKIRFSQAELNAAKQALLPLWEQSRFEERHVYPNRLLSRY
jgi:hypothetical protein